MMINRIRSGCFWGMLFQRQVKTSRRNSLLACEPYYTFRKTITCPFLTGAHIPRNCISGLQVGCSFCVFCMTLSELQILGVDMQWH